MPRRSSTGWFGWSRDESVPGKPSVVRARVTQWHFLATKISSCVSNSLARAAAMTPVSARPVCMTSSSEQLSR